MGDLNRIQQAQPIQVTDDSTQLAALSSGPTGTEVGLVVRNIPFGTQTTSDLADGSVNPGAAGSKSILGGMVYNTAAPAPTNGQQLSLQSDNAGNLKVAGSFVASGTQTVAYGSGTFPVSGTVTNVPSGTQTTTPTGTQTTSDLADGPVTPGAAAGKSILGGMVYNTVAPSPTNTQQLALQSDNAGNLKVAGSFVASGTQTVAYGSGTFPVSGTITNVPSGTQTTAPTGTQTVADLADGPVTPGAAAGKSILGGMVYNTAAPAPTNGQQLAFQSDSAGNLKVSGSLSTSPSGTQTTAPTGTQTTSDLADGPVSPGSAAGKSMLGGMVYNTVAPAPTNGQQLAFQSDNAGNLKVAGSLSTSPSGTQSVAYGSGTFITSDLADGPVSPGSAASKSMLGGMVYRTAAPAPTALQQLAFGSDASGNLLTNTAGLTYVVSTNNSSTAQLAAAATFTGTSENIFNLQATQICIYSDQPFTLYIDQFIDSTTTYPVSTDIFIVATTGTLGGYEYNQNTTLPGNYFRVRVTNNGGSTTTLLNINVAYGIMATGPRTITLLGNNRNAIMEINGTAADSNLGSASAGTLRVVLASNQSVVSTSDAADGPVSPGVAAGKSILAGLVYNTVAPAPTNGQQLSLQSDNAGNLKVAAAGNLAQILSSSPTGTESGVVTRNIPSGTQTTSDLADGPVSPGSAAAKSILGGMVYNTAAPAPTNSQQLALQSDSAGNLKVNVASTITTSPTGTQTTSDLADGPVSPGSAAAKSILGGMVYNTAAPAPTNSQQLALQSDSAGNLKVTGSIYPLPTTSGGLTIYRLLSQNSTNLNNIKGSAGQVYGWFISNVNASPRFVKLYNLSTTPSSTNAPAITILVPGNANGAGTNIEYTLGIAFGTGIGIGVTGSVADNDTTAVNLNEVVVNIFYR